MRTQVRTQERTIRAANETQVTIMLLTKKVGDKNRGNIVRKEILKQTHITFKVKHSRKASHYLFLKKHISILALCLQPLNNSFAHRMHRFNVFFNYVLVTLICV